MILRVHSAVTEMDRLVSARMEAFALARTELAENIRKERIRDLQVQVAALDQKFKDASRRREALEHQIKQLHAEHLAITVNVESANGKSAILNNSVSINQQHIEDIRTKIKHRGIVASLMCHWFGDSDSLTLSEFEESLRRNAAIRNEQDAEGQRLVSIQLEKQNSLLKANKNLDQLNAEIEQLSETQIGLQRSIERSAVELDAAREVCFSKERGALTDFSQKWLANLSDLDGLCKRIRSKQPQLDQLDTTLLFQETIVPDALAIGRVRLQCEQWKGHIPQLLSFPFERGFCVEPTSRDSEFCGLPALHQLVLRIITALPLSMVEIVVCDPVQLGESIRPFLSLLRCKTIFPNEKTLTRSDEIESALQREVDEIEDILQCKFTAEESDWKEFNRRNPKRRLPYRILLIFDAPDQLSDRSLQYLQRIVEHGPRCGIMPILTRQESPADTRRNHQAVDAIIGQLTLLASLNDSSKESKHVRSNRELEAWPSQSQLDNYLHEIAARYNAAEDPVGCMHDIWENQTAWMKQSIREISVDVGWDHEASTIRFCLGDTIPHALVAGSSGSGKSNFLHVLIHSLCHSYSPQELELYLLDFKEGTEMNVYAKSLLPHARLVATESDPEFGVAVLDHLVSELEIRAEVFKRSNVKDLPDYRETSGKTLSRILVVIDEFHELIQAGQEISDRAEAGLMKILSQGRSYGVHVLLSTQSIRGLNLNSTSRFFSNIGVRVCLPCSEEESASILSSGNFAGGKLRTPGEAIINNSHGAKSANQELKIPLAASSDCQEHLRQLSNRAKESRPYAAPRIFDGTRLPTLPTIEGFYQQCSSAPVLRVLFGERMCFQSTPLSIDLPKRNGMNLLCVGPNPQIQRGLLAALVSSILANDAITRLVHVDFQDGSPWINQFVQQGEFKSKCHSLPSSWDGDLSILPQLGNGEVGVLLIVGLDNAKQLQPGSPFRTKALGSTPSSSDAFAAFLDDCPRNGWHIVATADDWKRLARGFKQEVLHSFGVRIGFQLNEDDAGALAFGSISRLKGAKQPNRAFVIEPRDREPQWFRPYRWELEDATS
jgi:S-DNA-T family DNA segregation ATPase FtsK/SpoIIIE